MPFFHSELVQTLGFFFQILFDHVIRGFSQKKFIFGVINRWGNLVREGRWGLELAEEVVDLLDAPVIKIGRRLLKFGSLLQKSF